MPLLSLNQLFIPGPLIFFVIVSTKHIKNVDREACMVESILQNVSPIVSVSTHLMDVKFTMLGAVRATYGVVLLTGPWGKGTGLLAVVRKFVSSLKHFA